MAAARVVPTLRANHLYDLRTQRSGGRDSDSKKIVYMQPYPPSACVPVTSESVCQSAGVTISYTLTTTSALCPLRHLACGKGDKGQAPSTVKKFILECCSSAIAERCAKKSG